ncbi:hypothetical protein M8J75_012036 [Diaphorina citri]|nr:hypothetical protein M8J75_012036 [Diaphorina citri]
MGDSGEEEDIDMGDGNNSSRNKEAQPSQVNNAGLDDSMLFYTPEAAFKKSTTTRRSPIAGGSGVRNSSKKRKMGELIQFSPEDNNYSRNSVLNTEDDEKITIKVKGIINSINELKRLIEENPNTKKDIKKEVEKLGGYLKAVTEKNIYSYFKKCSEKTEQIGQEQIQEIESFPDNIEYEQYTEMEKKLWREEKYECTEIKAVNQRELEDSTNLMLIIGQKDIQKQLVKRIVERKTQSRDTLERLQMVSGRPIVFKSRSSVITSNEIDPVEKESRLCLLHLDYEDDEATTVSKEELFHSLKRTSQILDPTDGEEEQRLRVATLCNMEVTILRKLLESIFRYTGIKITILTRATPSFAETLRRKDTQVYTKAEEKRNVIRKNTNKVINVILQDEDKKNYAEVVKKMKEEINVEEVGVKVKSILQTKKGNARIVFEENSPHSHENFKTKIDACIGSMGKAVEPNTKKKLIIRDLDSTTTDEEVEKGIRTKLNIEEGRDERRVINLRKTIRGNMQTAIIEVEEEEASVLLREGRIKVGWVLCRIDTYITPTRCYRCLNFGHKVFECRSEASVGVLCYKCNKQGHRAAECQNEAYCQECDKYGHQSGNMACDAYKSLISQERRRLRRRISTASSQSRESTTSREERNENVYHQWQTK